LGCVDEGKSSFAGGSSKANTGGTGDSKGGKAGKVIREGEGGAACLE
jgi:hypothetical protein